MKRLWTLSCIMVLALASLASAQITFDFAGGGARAEGMGKAYYGLSDDINAVGWNPAGLVGQERPILGLSYGSIRPRGAFRAANQRFGQFGSFSTITNASFLAPIRLRGHQFVLSAAYGQVLEDYSYEKVDFAQDNLPNEWQPTTTYDLHAVGQVVSHFNPFSINFGFGTPIMKNLSAGLSANIYTGKAVQDYRIDLIGDGYRPADRLLQAVTRDSSISVLDSSKYSGINFTIGFKYVQPRVSAGLVIKTAYSLELLTDRKIADSVRYNGQVKRGITVYQDDQLQKIEIPWVIGLGVGYKMTDNWLISADVENRPYSGKKIKNRTSTKIGSGGNLEEEYSEFDPKWYSATILRAGTEYLWKHESRFFPVVPLRFGLGYVPVPTPNYAFNGSTTSTTMYNVTAGAGVQWSQIHLDLAYVLSIHDREIGTVVSGPDGLVYWTGEAKNRTHRLNMSFTGYF